MNKKIIILISLALLLIVSVYFGYGFINESEPETVKENLDENNKDTKNEDTKKENKDKETDDVEIKVGKKAPDFTLENLQGEKVSLSDYEGKIVMLNFWATWCGYCDKEMPDFEKLYNENKDKDFVILAVNARESKETVKEYINKGGYTFPVLLDKSGKINRKYLIGGLPTTYFISKDGILLGGVPGMMSYPQMKDILNQIKDES
ncbi:MAG: redoxin domain-containing protein [Firmicutes bacterium]|nr:redoxin domain-containing protein [Bacillota bacterium]